MAKVKKAEETDVKKKVTEDKKETKKTVKKKVTPKKPKVAKEKKQVKTLKREKKKLAKQKQEEALEKAAEKANVIKINDALTVNVLAEELKLDPTDIIKKLMDQGVLATINQRLDIDTASLLAAEYGYELELVPLYKEEEEEEKIDSADLEKRSAIITVMGHVDHGKTSLLDTIRKTDIVAGEAGGITQHIGAYQVHTDKGVLTFLDTPGHEAFTAMRARGAQVTDIVVIVVAADDGVMPQTIEAIDHAKAAGVPIIVAVNKIDLPAANPDKVMQEVSKHGLMSEDWGGDTIFVKVSAKDGTGITELIEMLFIQSEMMELESTSKGRAKGVVIEAKLDKKRGSVATVLVNRGILKKGDIFIVGAAYGKIRFMTDDNGKPVKEAGPSVPVEILGFNGVPQAGDVFATLDNEKEARLIAEKRRHSLREERLARKKHITLEDLQVQMQSGELKELNIIIKADVRGSVEALRDSLEKMSNDEIKLVVIHSGVGAVNESDIMLASASKAIVISFNLPVSSSSNIMAEKEGVEIRSYNIIYEVIEEIRAAMEGLLSPDIQEIILGKAEVRKLIKIPKIGLIAGSMVLEGKIIRGEHARVSRDGEVIHEGMLDTLKRFKDDVKEVDKGYECGVSISGFTDFKENDVLDIFTKEEVARKLKAKI